MQQAPAKKKKKIRVPKVVNGVETTVEIEVDDEGAPGWGPNDKHTLLNHHLRRVDGPLKVSGAAQYSHDKQAPGMLYARVLRSPHAHARVVKIDTAAARTIAGVRAIVALTDDPNLKGVVANFAGQPVAAVAADTRRLPRMESRHQS